MLILQNTLDALPDDAVFDVAVVGAGGAGLAAALFAALDGRRVLLLERTAYVGGTTAHSAGTTWIPGTHHAAQVDPTDTRAAVERYMDATVGDHAPRALRQAFLDHGPQAVARLEAQSQLRFRPYPRHPDYISDQPGATLAGRALEPLPFDGRLLGPRLALVRPPIPEFTVLGGMMVDRTDIQHLLGMTRSFASLRHALRILARHARDRLKHPRGTRLVMGNAWVARLLHSLSAHAGVTLALSCTVSRIEPAGAGGAPAALQIECNGQHRRVRVRGGVILASGGFNRHPRLRAEMLPGIDPAWSPAAPGHTGQAHELAHALGARYGQGGLSHAFWAPVSTRTRADGTGAAFPHFVMDRAKPGMLTVDARGERFVNESTSYHLFGLAMQAAGAVPAYLVCDARALRAYGLGMVRPGARGLAPYLADGYLVQGRTLAELAARLSIDPGRLAATVERFNRHAQAGVDPDFQRGSTAYQCNLGDPLAGGPNPNLGPLAQAPFYALRLYPGDIGAATGLVCDEHARVLDAGGAPIPGLYAVGNDMQSIMGGVYIAPGITLGPGLVFASIAAAHAGARI